VIDSLRRRAHQARAEIRSGALRGAALQDLLRSVPFRDRDDWVDELLGFEEVPPDDADLPRGSVPYLPCGVDEILATVRDAPVGPEDELVDLGSGLGRVVLLAHLLSGARGRGIEIQEHLVLRAREASERLALTDVVFAHANAADVALEGSVFFLYSPFNGAVLAAVLRRIEDVARRRAIVVCAVGLELRGVEWLRPRRSSNVSLALYDSFAHSGPHSE
jgi:hypothetical protein